MTKFTYFKATEHDRITITPEDIDACSDPAVLLEWKDCFDERAEEIKAEFDAYRIAGTDDDDWAFPAGAALAWMKKGSARIKRRLIAIGAEKPEWRLGAEIHRLNTLVSRAKMAEAFVHHARKMLSDDEFGRILTAATAPLVQVEEAA